MSDNTQILIRALEAGGSQREADLPRAILGDAPAPEAAPERAEQTPGQKYVQEQAAAAEQAAAGRLPDGILTVEELQRQEREGSDRAGMSHAEKVRANEQFCASAEYHIKNGSI